MKKKDPASLCPGQKTFCCSGAVYSEGHAAHIMAFFDYVFHQS